MTSTQLTSSEASEVTAEPVVPTESTEPATPEGAGAGKSDTTTDPSETTDTGAVVAITRQPPVVFPVSFGYYRLQTLQQGATKCLEGNRVDPTAVWAGAAFLDDCQAVTGQLWQLMAAETEGYYHAQWCEVK